ncbi:MAG: tetratricopeptide repeat protein [Acidobacteriota bacterium]|nr:tetratricopeptide repeat protein [Acidobacteriota bacterium]
MTHRVPKSLLVAFLSVVCGPFSVARAQSTETAEALANIKFTADVRVFTVMAALNAAGFDHETSGRDMSGVRQRIRRETEKVDSVLLGKLRTFYSSHNLTMEASDQQVAYTSLALLLSGPPEFQVTVQEGELPEDVKQILGFEKLVKEFYEKANIESLWQSQQPAYEEELTSYQTVVKDLIAQTLDYFRIPPRVVLDREIILIPDLLNAKTIVNVRNLDLVYYVVVGPTDEAAENHHQIQHEYLHFLIDPLIEKFGMALIEHGDLLELAHAQPQLKPQFQNKFFLLVAESLIETVLLRLHNPENSDRELIRLFRQGLIFAPYFSRELKRYEQETELISFPSYVETLLDGIENPLIEEDAKWIAALEGEIKGAQQQQLETQQRAIDEVNQRNHVTSLLNEAAILLSKREFQPAQKTLRQILLDDPDNGNAYFYLAQAASQTEQFEQAVEYYTRAANTPGIPTWVQAWSLLRIGNYQAFQGQTEEARTLFARVLELEGDLRGAREETQKSVDQLR